MSITLAITLLSKRESKKLCLKNNLKIFLFES